ncbi:MAG: SurA N-terminal domain-containing protein [Woeseia sp.]
MLQNIRDRFTGGFAIAILALLCVPFVFFGINYNFIGNSYAAKVNGEEISVTEFDNAYRQQLANYGDFGADLPAELRTLLKDNVLQNLIWDTVVDQYLSRANFRISDEMITEFIQNATEFKVDGKFRKEAYYSWLAERGIDPVLFEANQRIGLRQGQLQRGVGATAFVTPAEYRRFLNLVREQREVSTARFAIAAIAEGLEISEEEVQAWYDERPEAYLAPETVDLKYVELRRDDLASKVAVSAEELQQYYKESSGRYVQDEQRQASHILIPFGSDEDAARQQAEALAARAKAGEPFADLARQYSADGGTAERGGDLGLLLKTQLPDGLGDAIYSLRQSEVAGPVKTDFGFHVVQLNRIQAGGALPLDQVRAELEQELRARKADELWRETERALSDALFDAANIETIAAATGLPVKSANGFTREGGDPFGNNQAAIDAIFADAIITERRVSDIIELDANRSVAVQVTEYNQAQRRPLAEVRDSIVTAIKMARAQAIVADKAATLQAALKAGEEFAAAAAAVDASLVSTTVVTRDNNSVDANIRAAVFEVKKPAPGKPRVGSARTAEGDEVVFAVTAYSPGRPESIPVEQRDAGKQQLAGQAGQADYAALVFELAREADVVRNDEALVQQSLYQ